MKKTLAFFLTIALLITSAAAVITPRWSYVSSMIRGFEMTTEGLEWTAVAQAYNVPSVTDTKVVAKLQVQTTAGWGTIETQTDKQPGRFAGVGGVYTNWLPSRSYRIEMYAYIYNGSTIIETVGPLYAHHNT